MLHWNDKLQQGAAMKAKMLMLLAVASLMLGCVSVGNDFADDKVGQIQIGVTTQTDIKRLFGNPWRNRSR